MKRILIVNDDGINSEGIGALADALSIAGHDVRVSAPETNQSAVSHKVTLNGTLFASVSKCGTQNCPSIAIRGTPVDSLRIGLHLHSVLCPNGKHWSPEIVVSGVNHGNNLGICSTYSGTVSAAEEASLLGIRSISMSYDLRSYTEFTPTDAHLMRSVIMNTAPRIVHNVMSDIDLPLSCTICINLPNGLKTINPQFVVVKPASSLLLSGYSPNADQFWQHSKANNNEAIPITVAAASLRLQPMSERDETTDIAVLSRGFASVSLLNCSDSSHLQRISQSWELFHSNPIN